jgi:hypothetical protein
MVGSVALAVPTGDPATTSIHVEAGSTCTLLWMPPKMKDREVVPGSGTGHAYYWGKHRSVGEATMRPSMVDALANNGHLVTHAKAGHTSVIFATAHGQTVAWGQGPYNELGLSSAKSTAKPNFIESLQGIQVLDLACAYGHTLFVVQDPSDDGAKTAAKEKLDLPSLTLEELDPLVLKQQSVVSDASKAVGRKGRPAK